MQTYAKNCLFVHAPPPKIVAIPHPHTYNSKGRAGHSAVILTLNTNLSHGTNFWLRASHDECFLVFVEPSQRRYTTLRDLLNIVIITYIN